MRIHGMSNLFDRRHTLTARTIRRRPRCEALESREAPSVTVIDFGAGFTPGAMPGMSVTDGDLLLTSGPYQRQAVFAPTRVDVRAFQTSFVFRQDGGSGPIGDGLTFVVAGGNDQLFGTAGGGLGYQGITNSVAIKFDLVDNAGEGSESVGVYTGGAAPTTPAVNLAETGIDLHSGHPFRADITYDGVELNLTLTDTTAPDNNWTHGFEVDVPAAVGSSTGYVGFTAGTGELFARQTIESWTYAEDIPVDSVNKPPTITSAARVILESPTEITLGGGASDDSGAENLTYTWTVVSTPGGADPQVASIASPDFAAATRVTLDRIGAYTFLLTARDAQGLITTSSVSYVLAAKVTSLVVGPEAAIVQSGGTAQFTAVPLDQFGRPMQLPGPVSWQVVFGLGTIDANGLYTAPADQTGPAEVRVVVPIGPPAIDGFAAVTVVPATEPAGDGVDFSGGFEGANLLRNGAGQLNGPRLELANESYQAGSAYALNPVDVRGFSTSFRFQVAEGSSPVGDGLTFVLQNAGADALGEAGGGLGYSRIEKSVAVKFDLVDNAGEGSDSVGVYVNGTDPSVPADPLPSNPDGTGFHLGNGRMFQVNLSYGGGMLLLNLRDSVTGVEFNKAYAVDIPAVVDGPTAYVGFTGGTGELFGLIDVLDWTYTPTIDASGNAAPLIIDGPQAASYYVRGTSTELSALGADDGGEANLTYTWEMLSGPSGAAPVRFSANGTNAAKITTATVDQSGTYSYQLVVTDALGNATRSAVQQLEVLQVPGALVLTPAAPTVINGAAVALDFGPLDQFGDPLLVGSGPWQFTVDGPGFIDYRRSWNGTAVDAPPFTLDGPGFVDSSYRYHAPQTGTRPVTIRLSNGTVTGTATIVVVDRPSATTAEYSTGFETSPGLVLNGDAVRDGGSLRLTHLSNSTGSAFTEAPVDVRGFTTRFVFLTTYAPSSGSDGVAFVIQGTGPTALGAPGSGYGYQGIDHSVALVFDRQKNAFGLAVNGGLPVLLGPPELLYAGINLQGGSTLADLYYDGRTLTVALAPGDSINSPRGIWHTWQFPVDIPSVVGGPTAYVGFTGASGSQPDQFGVQHVKAWRYQAVPPGAAY